MLAGGIDAVLIETSQDLLQTKAATLGAKQALPAPAPTADHRRRHRGDHRHDALGSEIGAALTALEPLGIDMIGLNCATGPAEMSEHLRHLSQHARVGWPACPTPDCRSSPPTVPGIR